MFWRGWVAAFPERGGGRPRGGRLLFAERARAVAMDGLMAIETGVEISANAIMSVAKTHAKFKRRMKDHHAREAGIDVEAGTQVKPLLGGRILRSSDSVHDEQNRTEESTIRWIASHPLDADASSQRSVSSRAPRATCCGACVDCVARLRERYRAWMRAYPVCYRFAVRIPFGVLSVSIFYLDVWSDVVLMVTCPAMT